MKIIFEDFNENISSFVRECGYFPIERSAEGEWNCARSLQGQNYPRFHLYIKKEGTGLRVNLHLDQKKPSYGEETAHSGDYDSEIISEEGMRIRKVLAKLRGI